MKPRWRPERGPGYELRQYVRGRPTGLVAAVRHAESVCDAVCGPDVWLLREPNALVIEQHRDPDACGIGLRTPLPSCENMTIADEPGLVRVMLTVRMGGQATFRMSLTFYRPDRWFLQELAAEINGHRSVTKPPVDGLPLLDIEAAPDDEDWVVFRAGPSGDEVVRRGVGT